MKRKCKLSGYFWEHFSTTCYVPNDIKEARYCEKHGCHVCRYVEKKKEIKNEFGKEVCSIDCKIYSEIKDREEEQKWKEGLVEKVEESYNNLREKLEEEYPSFYEKIKNINLGDLKGRFIRGEIETLEFISKWHPIIENCRLRDDEKQQWKDIYQEKNLAGNLAVFIKIEQSFLLSLAKQEIQEKERQKEEKIKNLGNELVLLTEKLNQIEIKNSRQNEEQRNLFGKEISQLNQQLTKIRQEISELKDNLIKKGQELNEKQTQLDELNSNLVKTESQLQENNKQIEEINREFAQKQQQSESIFSQLQSDYSNLQKEINKREEKKLSALLKKASSCSNDELQGFIERLERFTSISASLYKKSAYRERKSKVDEVINILQKRWNDLSKEAEVKLLRENICRDFDDWIKQGENLILSNNCPFYNFKENVKNFHSKNELESQQKQIFQHVLIKFKKNVKEQLGAQELNDEYQGIEESEDFSAVKLARNNVRQGRKILWKNFIEGKITELQSLLDKQLGVDLKKIVSSSWKENLRSLKSKEKVNDFVKNMKKKISDANCTVTYKTENQEAKNMNLSFNKKAIGVIFLIIMLVTSTLIIWIKKKKKKSSLVPIPKLINFFK